MVLFYDCGHDSFDADAVTAHHNRNFLAVSGQNGRAHRRGILCAEFEDVANLHGFENFEYSTVAVRTGFTGIHGPEIGPLINFDVTLDVDATNVMIVFVRASRHVVAALEAIVGNDEKVLI